MGLLISLAPAAFQRMMPGLELKTSARQIAATLREARSLAIRDNREMAMIVDTEAKAYHLATQSRAQTLDEGLSVELTTAVSEQLDEGAGRIRFFPDGTSTGGRVRLSRGERSYAIIVDWLSGRVDIVE